MEVDSADDAVGASDIEIPQYGSHIAGRGFDDGLCMIDSIADISNMPAGRASSRRGGRKMRQFAGGAASGGPSPSSNGSIFFDPADPESFGEFVFWLVKFNKQLLRSKQFTRRSRGSNKT